MLTPDDIEQIRGVVRDVVREEIGASEERMEEFARGIETNLLTSFHGYGKGQAARLHTAEITAADLATRMAALEDRVLNLETRRQS